MAKEIPAFGSEKAEAEFWDTHDTLEYAGGEPVHLKLEPELAKKLADRQRSKRVTLNALRHLGHKVFDHRGTSMEGLPDEQHLRRCSLKEAEAVIAVK